MDLSETDFLNFTRGSEKSFEKFFHQYYKTLVSFAMRYGLSDMEAEDVVLETFHSIWEIRKEIKSSSGLHSLCFTTVKNKSLNIIRNTRNRNRILEEQAGIQEEEEEFYDYIMQEEIHRLLDETIANLPGQCRQVIQLLLAGKSLDEIAAKMGISINSVKTYRLRAIQTFREVFKDYPLLLFFIMTKLDF